MTIKAANYRTTIYYPTPLPVKQGVRTGQRTQKLRSQALSDIIITQPSPALELVLFGLGGIINIIIHYKTHCTNT